MRTIMTTVLVALVASSVSAQQWTVQPYFSQEDAFAEVTLGAGDPKAPCMIATADADLPFIVFRYHFAGTWIAPQRFAYTITADAKEAGDLLMAYCSRINLSQKCGIATLSTSPFAGEFVVWQTTPPDGPNDIASARPTP